MSEPIFSDLSDLAKRTEVPKGELDGIVRRLVEIYNPLRVYLFGSFVWGEPHWNSDLDLCCVVRTDEEAEHLTKVHAAFEDFGLLHIDFVLHSKNQFERLLSNPSSMEHRIYNEAAVLYSLPDVVFDENQPAHREELGWLTEAKRNIGTAKHMLFQEDNDYRPVSLFHVQQCIEFSLRAFRSFHLHPNLKTHDLKYLRRLCGKIEPTIKEIEGFDSRGNAERLSDYYWLRYHNERSKQVVIPDLEGVKSEIAIAERVYEFVKHYLETTAPPTEPTVV